MKNGFTNDSCVRKFAEHLQSGRIPLLHPSYGDLTYMPELWWQRLFVRMPSAAMIDGISKLNEHPTHPKLSARIGIDSGAVVVGAVAGKDTGATNGRRPSRCVASVTITVPGAG